jgi:hypothetical protein
MTETVHIHGDEWKLDDIREEIEWCQKRFWTQHKWKATPALVNKKGGRISHYYGQKYDPEKIDYVENGWTHDHCAICWFTIFDSDKQEENTGWTDGKGNWLCLECYDQFIAREK